MTRIDSRKVWSVNGMFPVWNFPHSASLWFIDNLVFSSQWSKFHRYALVQIYVERIKFLFMFSLITEHSEQGTHETKIINQI